MSLLELIGHWGRSSWDEVLADHKTVGEVADAVSYMHGVFGEEWKGWEKKAHLARCFDLALQGGPREWVRLHRLIRALEDAPHVDALVKVDLGSTSWTQYTAAVMSLEFCGRLRSAGCRVEFIQRDDDPSPPDCRIEIDGRWVTIEFKALHEPDAMQQWHEFDEWFLSQFPCPYDPAIGVDVECEEPALIAREAFLEGLLGVQKSGATTFQEFSEGTGRARCNGQNTWKWQYPVSAKLDLDRIIGKLQSGWRKKFDTAQTPTLLVVRTGMLFVKTVEILVAKAESTAACLIEALSSHPKVGGLLIYDEILWQPPSADHLLLPHYRLSVGAADGCNRAVLFVPNPNATIPLSTSEIESLVGPSMLW